MSGNGRWKIILYRLRCHLVLFLSLLIFFFTASGKLPLSMPTHITLRKSMNDTKQRIKIECKDWSRLFWSQIHTKNQWYQEREHRKNTVAHSLYYFHTLSSRIHFKTMRSQKVLFSFSKIYFNLFISEMCAISNVFSTFISLFTILAKEKCLFFFFHFIKNGENAFQNSYVLKAFSSGSFLHFTQKTNAMRLGLNFRLNVCFCSFRVFVKMCRRV